MRIVPIAIAAGALGGAALVVRRVRGSAARRKLRDDPSRWRFVTINRAPEEVAPGGRMPAAVAALGESVETAVRPAPGGRGTELGVRLVGGEPSGLRSVVKRVRRDDPRQDVRAALREAKQVIETGEVLVADRPGTTKKTVRSKPLELTLRAAGSEGRL
jgi:hypothetical protein